MPKYRRRPDIVDAIQVTDTNLEEVKAFLGSKFAGTWDWYPGRVSFYSYLVGQSPNYCDSGNWIVRDIQGRLFSAKSEVFADYFDEVL